MPLGVATGLGVVDASSGNSVVGRMVGAADVVPEVEGVAPAVGFIPGVVVATFEVVAAVAASWSFLAAGGFAGPSASWALSVCLSTAAVAAATAAMTSSVSRPVPLAAGVVVKVLEDADNAPRLLGDTAAAAVAESFSFTSLSLSPAATAAATFAKVSSDLGRIPAIFSRLCISSSLSRLSSASSIFSSGGRLRALAPRGYTTTAYGISCRRRRAQPLTR